MKKLWARKSIAALVAEAAEPEVQALTRHNGTPLRRTLSAVNLVALGVGAIIGAAGSLCHRPAGRCLVAVPDVRLAARYLAAFWRVASDRAFALLALLHQAQPRRAKRERIRRVALRRAASIEGYFTATSG